MIRLRDALTGLAMAALGGISVAAAVQVWIVRTPEHRVSADPNLVEWLLGNDLSSGDARSPGSVAHLLDRGLQDGSLWQINPGSLSGEAREKFEKNFHNLTWVWFISRVNGYSDLRSRQRDWYLDRFMRDAGLLLAWRYQADSQQDAGRRIAPGSSQLSVIASLASQIQQWQETANDQERQRIREFQLALQRHVFTRGFRSLIGGDGGAQER